jgi:outer membrane usher protein
MRGLILVFTTMTMRFSCLGLVLALFALALPALAQSIPQSIPQSVQQSLASTATRPTPQKKRATPISVPLNFNQNYVGDIDVRAYADGSADIDRKRLLALIAPLLEAKRRATVVAALGTTDFVAIADVPTEALTVAFDTGTLLVNVSVPAAATEKKQINLRENTIDSRGPMAVPANFSAGVRILSEVRWRNRDDANPGTTGQEAATAEFEAFARLGGADGVAVFGGGAYDPERRKPWTRRDIFLVKDFLSRSERLAAGEIVLPVTSLQTGGVVRGISFARRYDLLQPNRNLMPTGRQDFILERDSTVEFVVNGAVVNRQKLQSGSYNVDQFPLTQGDNRVQIIVEDAGGRRELLSISRLSDAALLGVGISEFGVSVGDPQNGGSPLLSGYYRRGLSDGVTLGGNLQTDNRGDSLTGVQLVLGTPIGALSLEGGWSRIGVTDAYASVVQLRQIFSIRRDGDLSVDWLSEQRTRSFGSPGTAEGGNKFLNQTVNANFSGLEKWSFSASAGRTSTGGPDRYNASLAISRQLGKWSLSGSTRYAYTTDSQTDRGFRSLITLSRSFGGGWNARTSTESNNRYSIDINRSSVDQLGAVGFNAGVAQSDSDLQGRARATLAANRFDIIGTSEWQKNRATNNVQGVTTATVSTFIGFADGMFGIGRSRGDDSFVVVNRHGALKGVDLDILDISGTRIAARTGTLGSTLVGFNRAYTQQGFIANAQKLPSGYSGGQARFEALPAVGAGYRWTYGSANWRSARGVLTTRSGKPVARALLLACRKGVGTRFFTNANGRFYADNLDIGEYEIVVSERFVGTFKVNPPKGEALYDVGTKALALNDQNMPDSNTAVVSCKVAG